MNLLNLKYIVMKKIILLFLSFGVVSCGQVKQQVSEQARVNVMSYNIRYDNPEDGMNNWQYRKDRAATAIRFYDVDILGTQEVLHNQLEDLKQRLPEYGLDVYSMQSIPFLKSCLSIYPMKQCVHKHHPTL